MKLKKLHITLLIIGIAACNVAFAQLFIDNAQFFIQPGATVTVQGDVTSNTNILGTGLLQLKGTAVQNLNMNGFTIPKLEIDNTSNVNLLGTAKVDSSVLFTNGNLVLGNFDLKIGTAGKITGNANTKFVVTSGTGRLVKAGLGTTAFVYPIGKATTSYTPVSIANSGTVDSIGARAFANVMSAGATGTAFTKEVVNSSWDITEAVPGGSNLTVSATWSSADELTGFDRTRAGISYYITSPAANVGWDLLNSQTAIATGSNPYTYTRTGVTSVGTFAIGTRPVLSPLLMSPKVFLQGAYNTGTAMMGDNLRLANLVPLTEPYSALTGFITTASRGSGGGETTTSNIAGAGAGASTNSTIVDWVLAQLHNAAGTVVTQRAVLLRRDGNIVETDGVSPVNFAGNAASAGPYYVSIRHRNHLGVRTSATLALAKVTTSAYDYTNALSKAYAGTVTNAAMATLSPGVFGMWGGDANGNKVVRYNGPLNDENVLLNTTLSGNKGSTLNGYNNSDFNLNGIVRYNGPLNDENVLLNTILAGNKGAIITQPNF